MAIRETSKLIDINSLKVQLKEQKLSRVSHLPSFGSTTISVGSDRRLQAPKQTQSPDLQLLELLKDGLDNIYTQLHWRIRRIDLEAGKIVAFNVYRRRFSTDEIERDPDVNQLASAVFNARNVDRISNKITKRGKFSEERKSLPFIKKGSIQSSVLNFNLDEEISKSESSRDGFIESTADFQNYLQSYRFEKIGVVDYTSFIAQQKRKIVFVVEREFVDLLFSDKKVSYNDVFEYFITSVTKEGQESSRSNSIKVKIQDPTPISPPLSIIAKQISDTKMRLSIRVSKRDNVSKLLIYKRSETDVEFVRFLETDVIKDSLDFVDHTVSYLNTYIYRAFVQNIFGELSEPKEITVFSSVKKITAKSQSNNLKIPVFNASSDQNSSNINISIFPNDPTVSYYELQRRDLSIHEKKFSKPSDIETNYGGDGWAQNKFFVERETQFINNVGETNLLQRRLVAKQINFIDDAITPGHLYQYRTRGFDLFGNSTSYQFSIVRSKTDKRLRIPINLRYFVVRGFPFRVQIEWNNDNPTLIESDIKYRFKIQRRRKNSLIYETFPLTENNFLIDEVPTEDFVPFSETIIDNFNQEQQLNSQNIQVTSQKTSLKRTFPIPDFLFPNDIYFYRIAVVGPNGEDSNYTEEMEVSTLPELSEPLEFSARVLNVKIRPIVGILEWKTDTSKALPDYWLVERKTSAKNDSFRTIGKVYLQSQFFDRDLNLGNQYIYRIKSFDTTGRESQFIETRLTI